MRVSFKNLSTAAVVLLACNTGHMAQTHIADNRTDYAAYTGRVEKDSSGATQLYWPGTSVKTKFEGTTVSATLKDEYGRNYYMVIVDNDSTYALKFIIRSSHRRTLPAYRLVCRQNYFLWFCIRTGNQNNSFID